MPKYLVEVACVESYEIEAENEDKAVCEAVRRATIEEGWDVVVEKLEDDDE